VLGDLDGRTAGEPLMALIEGVLRDHGCSVARNDPFKGVEIIARNGRPAERRHSLQIEVKRSCYADVERHVPSDGFGRVRRALDAMMSALADHVRRQGS
jgi:N-formylglutamate deformylase